MEKDKPTVRNQWGIEIVKCCASCKHKQCDNRTRLCMASEGAVPSDYLCQQWEQAFGFENAGRGGGKVKKKHYLDFCHRELVEDNRKAIIYAEAKKQYTRKSIAEIRAEYQKRVGSIYEKM